MACLQCTIFYQPDFRSGCGSISLQSESVMLKNIISRKHDPLFVPLLSDSNVSNEYKGNSILVKVSLVSTK